MQLMKLKVTGDAHTYSNLKMDQLMILRTMIITIFMDRIYSRRQKHIYLMENKMKLSK